MLDILQNEWVINIGGAVISGIILEILLSNMKKDADKKKQIKDGYVEGVNTSGEVSENIQQNANKKVVNKEVRSFTESIVGFIKFLITAIFRILALAIVFLVISLVVHSINGSKSSDASNEVEIIQWSILDMGDMVPEPKSNKIDIHSNSDEWLEINVYSMTEGDYYAYIQKCEDDYGYSIDVEKIGSSFWAYNENGYKLHISYWTDYMGIDLKCPVKFGEYKLPEYAIKQGLPFPKSELGYYKWEYNDNFNILIGDTTFEEYQAYVKECIAAGFTKDSQEGKDFYNGDNRRGYELSIGYDGYNTMHIDFDSPKD